MTDLPDFTSVIVTWNSSQHLEDCIQALRQSESCSEASVEIIVVDNASQDDSAMLAERVGADHVVANPINAGFAVAASQGIALARGKWIIMTNPDLVVDESFIHAVTDAIKSVSDEICCFTPEIRFSADPMRLNSRGLAMDNIGIPSEIGKGQLVSDTDTPASVFGGSGGGSLLRRTALDDIGAFEPAYFAYYEDVDLAWRLQRSGYRVRFLSDAKAHHAGSSTVGVASPLQTYLVARNRRLLFYRYGPHDYRARALRMFSDAGHAVISCLITHGTAPLRGRASAIRLRPYLHYLRRDDAARCKSSPDALIPRVSFRSAFFRKLQSIALEKRG
jgi:GT2 family glycosyltransferase